ncbi:polymer-forming cytoskeletal protein [Pelagibius sp. CAU 1746]|uniref:bactofilin family protein n=1 Tax=Pelagibius sp. CAU 1746 TaxID=3140370 RepID=UPI00325B31B9
MNMTKPSRRLPAGPDPVVGVRPGPGVLGLARGDGRTKEAPEKDSGTEGTLVVGEGIQIKGEIQSCTKLIVEGKVEASLEAVELMVREGGIYHGKAVVKAASIDGNFDGDLTVDGLLTILAGGRVTGALRYRDLKIERGGRLSGDIDLLDGKAVSPPEGQRLEEAAAR